MKQHLEALANESCRGSLGKEHDDPTLDQVPPSAPPGGQAGEGTSLSY